MEPLSNVVYDCGLFVDEPKPKGMAKIGMKMRGVANLSVTSKYDVELGDGLSVKQVGDSIANSPAEQIALLVEYLKVKKGVDIVNLFVVY